MLHCTPAAATTLQVLRQQQGLPETTGLRLFPARSPEGEITLGLGFADAPAEGDEVNEEHGARLFVAPEIAEQVTDMAIDVIPDPSANGSAPPQLVLRRTDEDS